MSNEITKAQAEGMREGILSQRRMAGLNGPHPYGSLDFDRPEDRRIIASVYADMAKPLTHKPDVPNAVWSVTSTDYGAGQ